MIKSVGIVKESNEDLKYIDVKWESLKFQFFFFLSFLYAQKRSLFWKWKKYDFFLLNSKVVELI